MKKNLRAQLRKQIQKQMRILQILAVKHLSLRMETACRRLVIRMIQLQKRMHGTEEIQKILIRVPELVRSL